MPYVRRISTKVLHTKFYTKATCDFFANVIEQQQLCLGILTNSSLERALSWLSIGGLNILSCKIFREISYVQSMQFYALPHVPILYDVGVDYEGCGNIKISCAGGTVL